MNFVTARQVGNARISVIVEGTTLMRVDELVGRPTDEVRAALPDSTADSEVEIAFTVCHIALGGTSLLIDTGVGRRRGPGERYTAGIEAGLARLGVRPEDVQHVVITHAHWDHLYGALVDGRPRFPKARHWIGRGDWDAARSGTYAHDLGWPILQALDAAGALDLVDGDREVAPGIRLLDAPGESPGHHAVLVESGRASFVHLADLYHHPIELTTGWVQVGTDPTLVQASRERILGEAFHRDALVTASHDPAPHWRRVVRMGSGHGVSPLGQ